MESVHVRAAAAAGVVTVFTSFGLAPARASAQVAQNLRPVAVEGQSQTPTGKIGEITAQTINNGGQISFRATYEDPAITGGTGTGNFVVNPGAAPQLVGGEGKPAPGTSAFFGSAALGPLNGLGQVAFNTTLQGGDVDPTLHNNNALYLGTPAAQQLVAREGDAAPDAPAGVIYARSATAGPSARRCSTTPARSPTRRDSAGRASAPPTPPACSSARPARSA